MKLNQSNPSNLFNKTKIIILSGPSGSGKTTIHQRLLKEMDKLSRIITYTTRAKRKAEIENIDYHFISKQEFIKLKEQNYFVESAKVFDNFYGISYQELNQALEQKKNVLLVIDWQGARKIRQIYKDQVYSIFIKTTNLQQLDQRLKDRAQDDKAVIAKRIDQAKIELTKAKEYDLCLINQDLEHTYKQIKTKINKALSYN